jgi:hypothetical protein
MASFFIEFLSRVWGAFLSAIGTTGLGFFASSVMQLFVAELATLVLIWAFRGKDAMVTRRKENLIIGASAYVVAVLTIYGPIYVRQMWKIQSEISNEGEAHWPGPINRHIAPPPYAYEVSSASIRISLTPQSGFAVDLGGPYSFADKKQYLLAFSNSTHAVRSVEIEIRFPYPVEAQKVVKVNDIGKLTFAPTLPLINLIGAQLEGGGCLGRWSYQLSAINVRGHGKAIISLILNDQAAAHPIPGTQESNVLYGNGYIAGSFTFNYRGKPVRSVYYSKLESNKDMMIGASEPQREIPSSFKKSSGFTVLAGPCIPDNSLLSPTALNLGP